MKKEYDDYERLCGAVDAGDLAKAEAALRSGADPNIKDILHGGTPLQTAAAAGNLAMVQLLVRHGAAVNMRSGDVERSALESAAISGRVGVVEWLLEQGANRPVGPVLDDLMKDLAKFGEDRIIELITPMQIHETGQPRTKRAIEIKGVGDRSSQSDN